MRVVEKAMFLNDDCKISTVSRLATRLVKKLWLKGIVR